MIDIEEGSVWIPKKEIRTATPEHPGVTYYGLVLPNKRQNKTFSSIYARGNSFTLKRESAVVVLTGFKKSKAKCKPNTKYIKILVNLVKTTFQAEGLEVMEIRRRHLLEFFDLVYSPSPDPVSGLDSNFGSYLDPPSEPST